MKVLAHGVDAPNAEYISVINNLLFVAWKGCGGKLEDIASLYKLKLLL